MQYYSRIIKSNQIIIKDNISICTDFHIGLMYQHLRNYDLTLDDSLYSIIIPISLEYINSFTRDQSMVLYEMAITGLDMNIESEAFWSGMFKKLD